MKNIMSFIVAIFVAGFLSGCGKAEANRILAASVTPELVQYQAVIKWDGKLPVTSLGGSAVPFIGVK